MSTYLHLSIFQLDIILTSSLFKVFLNLLFRHSTENPRKKSELKEHVLNHSPEISPSADQQDIERLFSFSFETALILLEFAFMSYYEDPFDPEDPKEESTMLPVETKLTEEKFVDLEKSDLPSLPSVVLLVNLISQDMDLFRGISLRMKKTIQTASSLKERT